MTQAAPVERGTGRTSRRTVAAAAALLFVGAGVLSILAAQVRWGQACADFDTQRCILVQDHLYDYLLPTDPWVPIGSAAALVGAGYVLLAVALALMFATVPSPVWLRLIQVMLTGSVLGIGLLTLAAAWTGRPVDSWTWVMLPWMLSMLILPTVVLQMVLDERSDEVMPVPAWCTWAAALALANPILEQMFGPAVVGYSSHDTAPWNGAVSGWLFVLAGVVVLVGMAWSLVRGRSPAQR